MNPIDSNLPSNRNLEMRVEQAPPQLEIDVAMDDAATIQVESGELIPPDQIITHFPDSNDPDGNTLLWMEQMLLDEAGLGDLEGDAREEALDDLKMHAKVKVEGKLLKESSLADSPVIADTYIDPATGERYYKFLMTWKMDATINGQKRSIERTQWIVTGVKQPVDFRDSATISHAHHNALLAVKCHRHIHKAAFNPDHEDYIHIRDCVEDVRRTNLVGIQGYDDENRLHFTTQEINVEAKNDNRSYTLTETIEEKQAALTLDIVLKDKNGKTRNLYIDQSHTGRKVNAAKSKYLKSTFNPENPKGYIPLAKKRKDQAHIMIIRDNPDLDAHLRFLHAEPDELENLLEEDRFEGVNARGLTFRQVKRERYEARKAQTKIYRRNAKIADENLQNTLMMLYNAHGDGIGVKLMARKAFSSNHSFTQYLIEQLMEQLRLEGDSLSNMERERLRKAVRTLATATEELKHSEQCQQVHEWLHLIDTVEYNPYMNVDDLDFMLDYFEEFEPEMDHLKVSSNVAKRQKILAMAAPLIDDDLN